jgi:hypothetical protein
MTRLASINGNGNGDASTYGADADTAPSLDAIHQEALDGFPGHADRMNNARENNDFYYCRNAAYLERRESEDYQDFIRRPKRFSRITHKVIKVLARDLYNPGPTRKLEGADDADSFLQSVYEKNYVNALMQKADRLATLNATCAIQAVATGRPEKPIKLYVWGAQEFIPFFAQGEVAEPWAIATIAVDPKGTKKRRRVELWSAREHRVYVTGWSDTLQTFGGTRFEYMPRMSGYFDDDLDQWQTGVNPYGVLPFCFVHDELPVCDFWEGGIGTALRECNQELDRELSDLAQHLKVHMNPDAFLRGVAAEWRREKRPGGWQPLIAAIGPDGEQQAPPEAFYVQPQLSVDHAWFDIEKYANSTLEELDVPLVAVRDYASTDLSGIAIVARSIPLLSRTKGRQVPFIAYETALARLILSVAGNYYGEESLAAAAAASLSVTFPTPRFPLPTPERDAEDQFEVENHIKSLLMVIQERKGMTRDQAIEHVEQVKEDDDLLTQLYPEPTFAAPDPNAQAEDAAGAALNDQGEPAPVDETGGGP